MARRNGATDAELEALADPDLGPFSEREKAAIRFAEKMTISPGGFGAADAEGLLEHWDPGEAVEIACTAGMFNYLNRFAEAFGLWPTLPGEGGPEDPHEEGPAPGDGGGTREGATE